MTTGRQAIIALGANLGDRAETLARALARLEASSAVRLLARSSLYETEPVGLTNQPRFLNQVAAIETTLCPEELLTLLQAIEREFGRARDVRWGPRTLDLDLLTYEGETRDQSTLILPHPRMFERAFVVVPLRELLDNAAWTGGRWTTLQRRIAAVLPDEKDVRRLAELRDVELPRDVHDYLLDLKRRGVTPGLERMRRLLAAIGSPHLSVPVIHVAGTNGKGSVAAMIEAILRAAGWRTGLYTSPHLVKLGERIQIDRRPMKNSELADGVRELRAAIEALARRGEDPAPSYFEFMTALAFTRFRDAECDVAIVEVGMGGRFDATNLVMPELSVVTSIAIDHAEFLGGTIEEIAAHKAGIIKLRRPVVIGRLPSSAEAVVRAEAAKANAPVAAVAEAFGADVSAYPTSNLEGEYQRVNAATATLATRTLEPRWRLNDDVIAAGLRRVDWPARWQRLRVGAREVFVDASHNPEGARALEQNLARLVEETGRRPVVVVGVLGAARAKPLLEVTCRYACELRLVVPAQARACRHEELAALVPPTFAGLVARTSVAEVFPRAGECAVDADASASVVVTGSIYLAGEVLAAIDPSRGPLESDLQDF